MSAQQKKLTADGIFSDLQPLMVEALSGFGSLVTATEDEIVIEQDAVQDQLYFVLKGVLQVQYKAGGEQHLLSHIGAGECIGEANIFYPSEATASIVVEKEALLWKIDKTQMAKFIATYPEDGLSIVSRIIELMSTRIKKLNHKVSDLLDSYAVNYES